MILFSVAGRLSQDNCWSERRAEFLHIRDDKSLHEKSGCCQSASNCSGIIDSFVTFVSTVHIVVIISEWLSN